MSYLVFVYEILREELRQVFYASFRGKSIEGQSLLRKEKGEHAARL
jgi:hypothetical protein